MMSRRLIRCAAFTLVEILVVIAIIGILISLTLPAIGSLLDQARRTQCQSQIRQLAVAATHYQLSFDGFPWHCQLFGEFRGGIDPADPGSFGGNVPPHLKVGGWPIALLSKLDAQPHYERWSLDRYPLIADQNAQRRPSLEGYSVFASPNMEIFQCPSALSRSGTRGANQYVANVGMHPGPAPFQYTRPQQAARQVTFASSLSKANGIVTNRYAGFDRRDPTRLVPVGQPVRLEDFKDGLSNTILLSENHQAMPWYLTSISGNTSHLTDVQTVEGRDVVVYPAESRYLQGATWHFEDAKGAAGAPLVNPLHRVNGGDEAGLVMSPSNFADVARPSSLHVGGAHVAMADGSVRFLVDLVDYRVYQSLMTPATRSSDVPMNEQILTISF